MTRILSLLLFMVVMLSCIPSPVWAEKPAGRAADLTNYVGDLNMTGDFTLRDSSGNNVIILNQSGDAQLLGTGNSRASFTSGDTLPSELSGAHGVAFVGGSMYTSDSTNYGLSYPSLFQTSFNEAVTPTNLAFTDTVVGRLFTKNVVVEGAADMTYRVVRNSTTNLTSLEIVSPDAQAATFLAFGSTAMGNTYDPVLPITMSAIIRWESVGDAGWAGPPIYNEDSFGLRDLPVGPADFILCGITRTSTGIGHDFFSIKTKSATASSGNIAARYVNVDVTDSQQHKVDIYVNGTEFHVWLDGTEVANNTDLSSGWGINTGVAQSLVIRDPAGAGTLGWANTPYPGFMNLVLVNGSASAPVHNSIDYFGYVQPRRAH